MFFLLMIIVGNNHVYAPHNSTSNVLHTTCHNSSLVMSHWFRICLLFPETYESFLLTPSYFSSCSLLRHLLGVTEEERQRRREEILSTR